MQTVKFSSLPWLPHKRQYWEAYNMNVHSQSLYESHEIIRSSSNNFTKIYNIDILFSTIKYAEIMYIFMFTQAGEVRYLNILLRYHQIRSTISNTHYTQTHIHTYLKFMARTLSECPGSEKLLFVFLFSISLVQAHKHNRIVLNLCGPSLLRISCFHTPIVLCVFCIIHLLHMKESVVFYCKCSTCNLCIFICVICKMCLHVMSSFAKPRWEYFAIYFRRVGTPFEK